MCQATSFLKLSCSHVMTESETVTDLLTWIVSEVPTTLESIQRVRQVVQCMRLAMHANQADPEYG
jgi:hypothetical protein